jgi:hypothetical protein
MVTMHMKSSSVSLAIREMQIRNTVRHHFTWGKRKAGGKEGRRNIVCAKMGKSEPLRPCLWHGTAAKEKGWWLLRKLNMEFPYDPAISLLGIYLGELKIGF